MPCIDSAQSRSRRLFWASASRAARLWVTQSRPTARYSVMPPAAAGAGASAASRVDILTCVSHSHLKSHKNVYTAAT